MPTVPVYNDSEVKPEALPQVRFGSDPSLEAFGGGQSVAQVEAAGEKLSAQGAEIYDRHQAMADQIFAANTNAKLTDIKNNLLYNNQDGLQMQKGANAFSAPEVYGQRFKDQTAALADTASNDRQRKVLNALIQREQSQFGAAVQKHVYSETQAYDKESTDSNISVAQNNAVDNYQNAGVVAQSALDITKNIDMFGQRQGWSPAQIQAQKTLALSKMNSDVIERMVNNGEDLVAKNYFDAHKPMMTADQIAATEKILETGMTRGESQRTSDAILAKTQDEGQAMQMVNAIQDPKVRDATETRVKDQFALQETIRRQRSEQNTQNAAQLINRGVRYQDLPPSMIAQMTPQAQESLGNYQRFKDKGIEPATDWTKYYDLKTMASGADTRQKFLDMDLTTVRGQMADGQFKELIDLQTGARKSDQAAQNHLDGFMTTKQIADDALYQVGIDPTKKGLSNKQQVTQFYRAADQQLSDFQQAKGSKATDAEKQKIMDTLVTNVVTKPGFLWDTKKPLFQVLPGETFTTKPADIPAADLQKIDAALKSRGIVPTDQMRAQLYQQKLQGMVPRGG